MPAMPAMPGVPAMPGMPAMPNGRRTPTMPETPAMPISPEAPAKPAMPSMPIIPEAPAKPAMPATPKGAQPAQRSMLDQTFDTYTQYDCDRVGSDLRGFVANQMGATGFKCLASWTQVTETQILFLVGMLNGTELSQRGHVQVCRVRNVTTPINDVRFVEPKLEKNANVFEPSAIFNEYVLDFCQPLFGLADASFLQPHVMQVNANATLGWKATLYPKFALQDLQTTRRTALGYKPSPLLATLPQPQPLTAEEALQIPQSFDHRVQMQAKGVKCKTWAVGEQKSCGSCWAFASARVYNDRLCAASEGRLDVEVAEQDMVSCYTAGTFSYTWVSGKQQITEKAGDPWVMADGCGGGSPVNAFLAMVDSGRVSRWADPYVAAGYKSASCGHYKYTNSLKYKIKPGKLWRITNGDKALIRAQIHGGGPVVAGMKVYQDLLGYKAGVYQQSSSSYVGRHLVALVGWGTDRGKKYWTFANSWGSSWGEDGYGRIKEGQVDIETEIVYPDLTDTHSECAPKRCSNGGEFTTGCGCHCIGLWSGSDCATCARSCENGGLMRKDSCTCSCVPGYFGPTCNQYWLAQWDSGDGADAKVRFSWKVDEIQSGSKFVRYAKEFGSADNPIVSGYNINIEKSEGVEEKTINLNSRLPKPYPSDYWAYAVHVANGKNEFGHDMGYKVVDLPPLVYDRSNSCYKGGYKPGPWSSVNLCAGSYSDALLPAGTAAPVERFTQFPTTVTTPAPVHCRTAGKPYRGSLNEVKTGTKCKSWNGRSGYEYMNGQGAFCRETQDWAGHVWCFTEDVPGNKWNECILPNC